MTIIMEILATHDTHFLALLWLIKTPVKTEL